MWNLILKHIFNEEYILTKTQIKKFSEVFILTV